MTTEEWSKHFIALESNPELFTELIHTLGVSTKIVFQDVFSIDEPELLAMIPKPVLALVLVLPTTAAYEKQVADEEIALGGQVSSGDAIWFQQTINNACGLYAILHAVANGVSTEYIKAGSTMSRIVNAAAENSSEQPATLLEQDDDLESAYRSVALRGDTAPPENAEEDVDYHYICLVKTRSGKLYELDGMRTGPVERGTLEADEDILSPKVLDEIRSYIKLVEDESSSFSLMALCEDNDQ